MNDNSYRFSTAGSAAEQMRNTRLLNIPNGSAVKPTFSEAEMQRRTDMLRAWMNDRDIDAALFSSYHNINYYADFLFCHFGRFYGLVITPDSHTTISANIDGGQPWRRSFGDNIVYTDWQRDNYFHAVKSLLKGYRRIGVEFDHLSVENMQKLRDALPDAEFIDISKACPIRLSAVKLNLMCSSSGRRSKRSILSSFFCLLSAAFMLFSLLKD